MNLRRNVKWGRAALLSGIAALLVLTSSCGSERNTVSSASSEIHTDSSQEASHDDHENIPSDPLERLAGNYYIDGDRSAACVKIEADGSFTAFYASGTVEQEGSVRYEEDNSGEKTYYVYVFYTSEGKPYMGFVDSGESKIPGFETGNGSYRYIRVD